MPSDSGFFSIFQKRADEHIPLLQAKNVSFFPDGREIIKDVSLTIEKGSATALVGKSGSGKTRLLKLLAGLVVPTYGKILYKGRDVFTASAQANRAFRKEMGFVFQDSALWANQTLRQNLELPLKLHFPKKTPAQIEERIRTIIEMVGYEKSLDIRPVDLSQGEKKLIGFARALLCSPSLLYLDEWTESLDVIAEKRLNNIVLDLKKKGTTLIFVTHTQSVIKSLCDDVCFIESGQIKSIKKTQEFFSVYGDRSDIVDMGIQNEVQN